MPEITFTSKGVEVWDVKQDFADFILNPTFLGDLDTCIRTVTRSFHVYPKEPFNMVLHPDQKQRFRNSSGYCPNPFSPNDDMSFGGIYQSGNNTIMTLWDNDLPVNIGIVSTGGHSLTMGKDPKKIWQGGLRVYLPDRKIIVKCPAWASHLVDGCIPDPTVTDTIRFEVVRPNHFSVFEVTQ